MNKRVLQVVAFLMIPGFILDPVAAIGLQEFRFAAGSSPIHSCFSEQAVVEPALQSPIHPADDQPAAWKLRQAEEQAAETSAAPTRRNALKRGILLASATALPAAAQTSDIFTPLVPHFTDQEQRILHEEVDFIIKTYVPELAGMEDQIVENIHVRSSMLRDYGLLLAETTALGLGVAAAGIASVRWVRLATERLDGRVVTRREALRLFLFSLSVPYLYYASKSYQRYSNDEIQTLGSFKNGAVDLARHRMASLSMFRYTTAHELFHYLRWLGLFRFDAAFANAYAALRVYQIEGQNGLNVIRLTEPATLGADIKQGAKSRSSAAAFALGNTLFDRDINPEHRDAALVAETARRFGIKNSDFWQASDANAPWLYFYGSGEAATVVRLAKRDGFDYAYGYVGARGANLLAGPAQEHPWNWMKSPTRPSRERLREKVASKPHESDWIEFVKTSLAITIGLGLGLATFFAAQRLDQRRWSRNRRISFIVGGLVAGWLALHPLIGIGRSANLTVITFGGFLAGALLNMTLSLLIQGIRWIRPNLLSSPLWNMTDQDSEAIHFQVNGMRPPMEVLARTGLGRAGNLENQFIDHLNQTPGAFVASDRAGLLEEVHTNQREVLPSIEENGWAKLKGWTHRSRDNILAGLLIRNAVRTAAEEIQGRSAPIPFEKIGEIRAEALRRTGIALKRPAAEIEEALQHFLAQPPDEAIQIYRTLEDSARRQAGYTLAHRLARIQQNHKREHLFVFVELPLLERVISPKSPAYLTARMAMQDSFIRAPMDIELARMLWSAPGSQGPGSTATPMPRGGGRPAIGTPSTRPLQRQSLWLAIAG